MRIAIHAGVGPCNLHTRGLGVPKLMNRIFVHRRLWPEKSIEDRVGMGCNAVHTGTDVNG
jgi:hypothetical protein